MHRGKARKRMMKHDVVRSLGIRKCYYFNCFRGCLAEVLHWHIEVVDALVDVVCAAVLKTCGFTLVLVPCLSTLFTHQPLKPKPNILNC